VTPHCRCSLDRRRGAGGSPESRGRPDRTDLPPARFVLLDLRDRADHRSAHIPGSVCLPATPSPTPLRASSRAIGPASIPHDASGRALLRPGCIRSRNGATQAARYGFRDLRWFRGAGGVGSLQRKPCAALRPRKRKKLFPVCDPSSSSPRAVFNHSRPARLEAYQNTLPKSALIFPHVPGWLGVASPGVTYIRGSRSRRDMW